ncbi:unnamed protein product [Mycena citricolor]|uniref:Fungal lipase-type domain-containing protein n=1 Tax=Mycena citricolor TaxID=2018698 RepID=A0AAD2JU55_9AGAR|nr:unnamed protein product [Mycena citricolor]
MGKLPVITLPKSMRKQYILTEEQAHMYAMEKLMNFRWISKILATYAPDNLSLKDVAPIEVSDYCSEIGQFAEVAYSAIPPEFIFGNLDALMQPAFPLENYTSLRGTQLVASFFGQTAHLQGYAAYRSETKQLILAFQGTNSAHQALYDIHALKHRHPSRHGKVHSGFWRLYKGAKQPALEALRKGLAQHEVEEVVVTGHSMGAAVSQLLLVDLLRDESLVPIGSIPIRVVVFGGPRSGTRSLVKFWVELVSERRKKHGPDSIVEYAVKMYNDGVPSLPPLAFGYRHFAQTPYYFVHERLYCVPEPLSEYALFRIDPAEDAAAKPPLHPRGGHNYYNGRDMERFARHIGYLDKAMKKEGDWRDRYREQVAKHEHA